MSEFVCCECGVKRGSKEALESHICLKHLQWLPFECSYCSANHRCTREATEHDLIVHINEAHPGQQNIKIISISDNHKRQLLNDKMRQSTKSVANRSLVFAPPAESEVVEKKIKTVDGGDVDAADAQSTNHITHSTSQELSVGEITERGPGANSMPRGGTEPTGVEGENNQLTQSPPDWRNIDPHESDDNDFEPFPPLPSAGVKSEVGDDDFKPDTDESPGQQADKGHSSGVPGGKRSRLKPKVKGKGAKDAKPKQATSGYCRPDWRNIDPHESDDDDFKPDESDGDDFEPDTDESQSQQVDGGHPATAPSAGAKSEVGDDDDFEPDTDASQGQQVDEEGHSSGLPGGKRAKSKPKLKVNGTKARTPKQRRPGYCLTCEHHYIDISRHLLLAHLSSPVYECSKCTYKTRCRWPIKVHVRPLKCRGAKVIRIRSETDDAAEMQRLKETHFGLAAPKPPYRCTKCKMDVSKCYVSQHILKHHLKMDRFECPVCGWSGHWAAVKTHMKQKHRPCKSVPIIDNVVKFRDRIRKIRNAVIVRNE